MGDTTVVNNPGQPAGTPAPGQPSQPTQPDTKAPGVPSPQPGGPDAPTPPGQTAPAGNESHVTNAVKK